MNPPENAPSNRWDKLPPGLRRLLENVPERDWPRIRAFHIQTDEEAELAATLPLARRAIELCPPKMIARIRAKEITGTQVDEAYRKLHDSIHAVREALLQLFEIAGVPLDPSGRRPYTRKIPAPADAQPTAPA
ncbi:MAG TPA: hypothetical protein VNO22_18755 [Planctomycetota bacterium]|nr:hypothetical protein [Planctomycetota bacterium]